MTRPTPPPDPSNTFVDDDADGEPSKTGEMSPMPTETTAAALPPVPSTNATFVELAPTTAAMAPVAPSPAPAPPRKSRVNHPVLAPVPDFEKTDVSISDAIGKPAPPRKSRINHPGVAPQQTAVSGSDTALPPIDGPRVPGLTMTTESEPDPLAQFRAWLRVPRFRNQRIAVGGALALLFSFGALLGSRCGSDDPGGARPIARAAARVEPSGPREAVVLEAPTALQAAAPIWLERAVDAGEGTVRMEKVEAGLIKIHSVPDTEVVMNGQRLGPVPVFITAPVGKLEFVLESRDAGIYRPIAVPLYSGRNPGRMFELGRGWLEVVAPRGSQVLVNGRAVGTAPVPQLELYEGFHRLEVVRPDKSKASKSVEVVPRFTTTHEVSQQ